MISLLSRGPVKRENLSEIQGRTVLYSKNIPQVSLTLFDGGHEMLSDYCFARMMEMAGYTEK